eukprot:872797-Rhodomonas_salina.1
MSGTELVYGATHVLPMSGTELAYGGTRRSSSGCKAWLMLWCTKWRSERGRREERRVRRKEDSTKQRKVRQ